MKMSVCVLAFTAIAVSACHVSSPRIAPAPQQPVYQQPPPVYQQPPPVYQQPQPVYQQPPPQQTWQRGGPPPWAPAHGYRRKQNRVPQQQYVYAQPYGIRYNSCYREDLGRALGGVAGAVAGYQVGGGHGKVAAVIGGTIIGMLVGGHIGRSMDDIDQNCIGQILEHAQPNQPIAWNNPQNGGQYQVTPQPAYNDQQGRYCREYQTNATIGGRTEQTYGRACRQPDGSWQIVN